MIRATIIAPALGFGAGWLVNGWRQDALELISQKAAISATAKT
jgi:hypothetical protein